MNFGAECLTSASQLACAADVLRRELDKVFLTYDEIFNLHFWLNWFKVLASRHEERELTLPVPLATFLWALLRKRNLGGTDTHLMDLVQRSLPRNFFQTRVVFFVEIAIQEKSTTLWLATTHMPGHSIKRSNRVFSKCSGKGLKPKVGQMQSPAVANSSFHGLHSRTGSRATLRLLVDQTITVTRFDSLPGCIMVEVDGLSEDEAMELISWSQSPTAESVWTSTLADDIVCVAERFANWKQDRVNNKVARILSVFHGKRAEFPESYRPACLTRVFRVAQVPNIKTLLCVPMLCYIWSAEVTVTVREPGTLPYEFPEASSAALALLDATQASWNETQGSSKLLCLEFVGRKDLVVEMAKAVQNELHAQSGSSAFLDVWNSEAQPETSCEGPVLEFLGADGRYGRCQM